MCPMCSFKKSETYVDYKAGTDLVHCGNCGFHAKYFRRRGDDGNFHWETKSKQLLNNETIITRYLKADPLAVYIVKKSNLNGSTFGGDLYNEKDIDNFISFFKYIENNNPKLKKVTITKFLKGRDVDIILYPKNIIG